MTLRLQECIRGTVAGTQHGRDVKFLNRRPVYNFLSAGSTSGSAVAQGSAFARKYNEGIVIEGVNYRGYSVFHDGHEMVAEPVFNDGENFEIASDTRKALYHAIDELWTHLNAADRFDQAATVPAWYQCWLDKGADGRVRISTGGKHECIAPSRSWWGLSKLLAGAMVCAAAVTIASPKFDLNGDGSLDRDDLSTMVEKIYLAYPPKSSVHHVRWGHRIYDVHLVPAPDESADFDANDVRINGVSVTSASSTPRTGMQD